MSDVRSLDLGATNKALHVTLANNLAGERQTGTSDEYMVGVDESDYTVVTHAAGDATILAVPAHLFGIYINIAPSHPFIVKDDATSVLTVPVAAASAGSIIRLPGIRFTTNLKIAWNASENAGNITVIYRKT